ncbi:hypothetical protein V5O48_003588 [Marasmius crinis-equi]|uniref:Uncharacterized protein n=1 Tax=Marasmius crinis-equi TaxID=585013 RepID=A0ABR3FSG0_9AGAR
MPPRTARTSTASSAPSGTPSWDGDAFVKDIQQAIQDCLNTINLLPGTEKSALMRVLNKLPQPLVADQVAAHDSALNTFKAAVDWLTLQYQGLEIAAPEGHGKLVIFKDIIQKRQNVLKAAAGDNYPNRKRPRACAAPKSKAYINDDDESDFEIIKKAPEKAPEVHVLIFPVQPVLTYSQTEGPSSGLKASIHAPNEAEENTAKGKTAAKKTPVAHASTVSIPYSAVPGMDTSSGPYLKALFILSKVASKLPSFKKARIEVPMSNTAQESPNESVERLVEAQQVARFTSLVPFLNMETLEANVLLFIANFLKTELATLAHAVQYYSGQYQYVHRQLEDANRHHLAKMRIGGDSEASEGGPTPMNQDAPSKDVSHASGSNVTLNAASPSA